MKTLFVVRHAKSSWSDPDLRDFDRPLNKRGARDAPRMGRHLRQQGVHLDGLVASPAKRAWTTARLIAEELGYPTGGIDAEPKFYGADVHDTLTIARGFTDDWTAAMIVGHNPTTTAFVNWLTRAEIDNVPTCGVAEIRLHASEWIGLGDADAELVTFLIPKAL